MLELLEAAKPYLAMGFKGIRLSTRPDAIDEDILDILKNYGVSAIELGAQSMCDEVLLANERGHTAQDVSIASGLIRSYGFTLGLQMMVGLLGSSPEKDIETAKRLIALKPAEVRIYPTVILDNTRLGELYKSGEYKSYPLDTAVSLCAQLLSMFEDSGIRVIKLGLHSSAEVERGMLGGIYHPAFRELCEAAVMREAMQKLMPGGRDEYLFTVPPEYLSKALGQHRANIEYFKSRGIKVTVKPAAGQTEKILLVGNS